MDVDYREALMNLSDSDLKVIYQQTFGESDVADMHQIELVESIRKEVLSKQYIRQMLTMMPEDEYKILMSAVKKGHGFIPMPAERMPFSLQFLMMFESSKGLEIPYDLIDEINQLKLQPIEEDRRIIMHGQQFITGAMVLYGVVHEQHLAYLYDKYFNEPLAQETLNLWIEMLGLEHVGDMVMMPMIGEQSEKRVYHQDYYYIPESYEELSSYAGSDHHRDSKGLQSLLEYVEQHLPEDTDAEELKEMITFLIASTIDANMTMESLIDVFAKHLSEDEFEQFETLYVEALDTTRLWAYGGKTVAEAAEKEQQRIQQEAQEKEKKVIDIDVFRHE